jgi:folate-binding protein YgfZ
MIDPRVDRFQAPYAAVRDGGAGLLDLSSRGRLHVTGSEAVMFLNGLITNDMKTLEVNSWMPAAFANVHGRLLAAIRVIHREDGFLIDTEEATRDTVIKLLERLTLAGDFRIADLTGETALLSVQGKKAREIVHAAIGGDAAEVDSQKVLTVKSKLDAPVTIVRATHTGEDGFDVLVNRNDLAQIRNDLTNAGVVPIGEDVMEILRIEAGIPRYGIDMDETSVVTETNLDDAVSFTKGCYLGQEIIVRIKHRGHVAKKFTGIILAAAPALAKDTKVLSADDREIGRLTSSTFSPRLNRTIALGYVKYDHLAPGTAVKVIAAEEKISGAVANLPFVRGSWYEKGLHLSGIQV